MKPEFIMLVGLPASGKTTWAHAMSDYIVHSSDEIRKELYGDEAVQEDPEKVFNLLHKRIIKDLKKGKSCIYDATNLVEKRRRSFLKQIERIDCDKTCVVFAAPIKVLMNRDSKRDKRVGKEVILKMLRRFDVPSKREGWNKIILISKSLSWSSFPFPFRFLNMEHDNPHHPRSVGWHMMETINYAARAGYDHAVMRACGYHDIGKPMTKSFLNHKGKEDTVAHYYNHEHVGSYLFLLFPYGSNAHKLHVSWLIGHHMRPFVWDERPEVKEKDIKRWGERLISELELIHEADLRSA